MALDFIQGGANTASLELPTAAITGFPCTLVACTRVTQYTSLPQCLLSFMEYNGAGLQDFISLTLGGTLSATQVLAIKKASFFTENAFSGVTFPLNTWICAGMRCASASSMQAFHNGIGGAINTNSLTPSGLDSTLVFCAHSLSGYTNQTNGCGAYIAAWDVALTDPQMLALGTFAITPAAIPANRVFYAPTASNATKTVNLDGSALTVVTVGTGSFSDCDFPLPTARRYQAMIGPIRIGSPAGSPVPSPTPTSGMDYLGGYIDDYIDSYF